MRIRNIDISFRKVLCLFLYYTIAYYLPSSTSFILGNISKRIRFFLVERIFLKCGKNVNIESRVCFGSGRNIIIGNNSGIGAHSTVPSNVVIGENVMIGPNLYILAQNHSFNRIDVPMIEQGFSERRKTVIEDDVWIGRNVLMTPGRQIKKGSIIAGGCVLCKDFPEYSIVGGNPSRLIRSRLTEN